MCPGLIGSPSLTWAAGSGPCRRRISGSALVPVAGRWRTTNTAAGSSPGREAARSASASTPPAEAPTTTMPWSGMNRLLSIERTAAVARQPENDPTRPGWPVCSCTPPSPEVGELGPLLGQQLAGQLADLGEAARPGLGGGELAAGAVPCRHHPDEGQVERGPLQP